jgi:adenine-specific DNA-methyltransferase
MSDKGSPITQRRSGKPRPESRLARYNPISARLLPNGFSSPLQIVESGRTAARELAIRLKDDPRLAFARAFCTRLIRSYWLEIQRPYRCAWPLDNGNAWLEGPVDQVGITLAEEMGAAAAGLDPILASYLIGTTYTGMIPDETRSRLGVYYTPPGLTCRLLDMATRAGVDWKTCRVIDPACGGGAFLAPVAARLVSENRHLPAKTLVKMISGRVRGLEIDPFAAWASQVFLEAAVLDVCQEAGERLANVVEICNSLLTEAARGEYDLVIGNPPYGRVTLTADVRARFRRSLFGHANLYGLFTDLAVQLTKRGGVIAYVTPTSFLAGEYFKSLRSLIATEAPPVNLDFVSLRKGVFDDALQETLLATYKRGGDGTNATVHFLAPKDYERIDVKPAGKFNLPQSGSGPWLIPRTADQAPLIEVLRRMPHRLSDYGYEVSTGPLVWNRHKGQLTRNPAAGSLPLIWAECVTADGKFVFRADKKNHEPYFRPKPGDDWLISRKSCVLLQRTTAKEQNRRLIAAELPKKIVATHGAVVIENHLNMIRAKNGSPRVTPKVLAAFLNTEVVDRAFRCLSGSVAVSAYELEALPLPSPDALAHLASLVARGASTTEIEAACSGLFLAGDRSTDG